MLYPILFTGMMMYLIYFIDEEYEYTYFTNIPYYVLYSITLVLVFIFYLSDPGVVEGSNKNKNENKQLTRDDDSNLQINKLSESESQLLVK